MAHGDCGGEDSAGTRSECEVYSYAAIRRGAVVLEWSSEEVVSEIP